MQPFGWNKECMAAVNLPQVRVSGAGSLDVHIQKQVIRVSIGKAQLISRTLPELPS
jgi:hypothetical protein